MLIGVKGLAEKNKMDFQIKGGGSFKVMELGKTVNIRMVESD